LNKEEILKKVGSKIKEIRTSKGLSQVELTAKMELSTDPNNISRLEAGRNNLTLFTLARIAQALDTPMKDLVDIEM